MWSKNKLHDCSYLYYERAKAEWNLGQKDCGEAERLRKERNLTQENVRFDLELNIGRIEAAQHSITFSTLGDLCDYYGVTLEEFFRGIHTK